MKYYIIDDIIPQAQQKWIEDFVFNEEIQIPWYYKQHAISAVKKRDPRNVPGFFHYIYSDDTVKSNLFDMFYPIILAISEREPEIKWNKLDSMRLNLFQKEVGYDKGWHLPHVDHFYRNSWSGLYYVNTNNGDTHVLQQHLQDYTKEEFDKIQNDNDFDILKEPIKPKRGRVVIFPSNHFHCSSYANDTHRCVLNFNLINLNMEALK
jgi:hypothetical protein